MPLRSLPTLLLLALLLSGCSSVAYYAQSVRGQLDLMLRQQSIDTLLSSDETAAPLRKKLQLATEIRHFAGTALVLPANQSYLSYVEVGSEAIVWSVVATEAFSVTPKQWCYPVIGCASYRGYFSKQQAMTYAAELIGQGLDVTIEPVPAYSTLGWFNDPLPSTVIDWPAARFAGLIFHELAHQQLYIKGDSAFNEAFATMVEQIGVERWLAHRGQQQQLAHWQQGQLREQAFVGLLLTTRQRLEQLYQSAHSVAAMQARKAAIFSQLQQEYAVLRAGWGGYGGFDRWFSRPLNNARLASLATYERWVPAFRRLLLQSGGDLTRFYRACSELGLLPAAQRQTELERLRKL